MFWPTLTCPLELGNLGVGGHCWSVSSKFRAVSSVLETCSKLGGRFGVFCVIWMIFGGFLIFGDFWIVLDFW